MEKVFCPSGAVGVQCQIQRHPNMWTGAAGDLTTNPAISGRSALPPEPCTTTLAGATWGITKPDWLDPFGVFWIYPSSSPTWTHKAPWGSHPGSILCRCLNPPQLTSFNAKQHQLCCVPVRVGIDFELRFIVFFEVGIYPRSRPLTPCLRAISLNTPSFFTALSNYIIVISELTFETDGHNYKKQCQTSLWIPLNESQLPLLFNKWKLT